MPIVLVVDDSPMDRLVVGRLLEKEKDPDWVVEFAESGDQALEFMEDVTPDVVVTDLILPGMDGLQLTEAVRTQFPQVPVILITGQGSETLAVEALDRGAASYVPKGQMADNLLDTVKQVLSVSRADSNRQRLTQCLLRSHITLLLDNDASLIPPLVDLVQQMLSDVQFCDTTDRVHLGIALEEALLNALFHGSLALNAEQVQQARAEFSEGTTSELIAHRRERPPFCDRRIYVDLQVSPSEARFLIRDEGTGFIRAGMPERGDPRGLQRGGGRGLVLMRNFMDEVLFNEAGNEVTLVKHRPRARILHA
jgi:CheY-like chemotaxis protein/anti-sigma regulatory factor (Ser/Thr protein kinase)